MSARCTASIRLWCSSAACFSKCSLVAANELGFCSPSAWSRYFSIRSAIFAAWRLVCLSAEGFASGHSRGYGSRTLLLSEIGRLIASEASEGATALLRLLRQRKAPRLTAGKDPGVRMQAPPALDDGVIRKQPPATRASLALCQAANWAKERIPKSSWRVLRPVIRALAVGCAALLALPYLLTPLYRVVDPVSTLMLWRWATGARVERAVEPIDLVGPTLPRTVLAAEDERFCRHHGIDLAEMWVVIKAETGGIRRPRGGSTITQQLAKNLFLWQGHSYVRKALEFPLALWIDLVIPKRRQLEIYLNIAEWGPNGEFGAEAGARRAFGKPANALSTSEAALLAAALPNPARRDARRPGEGLRRLAVTYVARAAAAADIDRCMRSPAGRDRSASRDTHPASLKSWLLRTLTAS
jgi:monofunctional glycosyltransferase